MELRASPEAKGGEEDASSAVAIAGSASIPAETKPPTPSGDRDEATLNAESTPLLQPLAIEREALVQQLASNERAMAEFRRGIEQSPLMERNELIREILRMEYRIGDLELDKVQLQTLRDLQVQSVDAVQHGNNDELPPPTASQPDHEEELVPPPELQPQNTDREVIGTHLPELQSRRTPVNGPEGSTETRLEPEEVNGLGDKPQQLALTAASPVTFRKNWGLHMTNTALPYIRLKKTNPVPLFVEPASSLAIAVGGLNASAAGKATPTSSLTAPYLKALKQRRKAAGKSSSNTKKKQLK
ncbi:hypothetical protein BBJ28_00019206 [Nothophytophthora sp. Chile5]|nr:hypothetical protein BBJ28_00019206 [Nothophytophthora sp. Chile5]